LVHTPILTCIVFAWKSLLLSAEFGYDTDMKRIVRRLIAIVSETWTISWENEPDDTGEPQAPLVVPMTRYAKVKGEIDRNDVEGPAKRSRTLK
jgi:hypothetical protein